MILVYDVTHIFVPDQIFPVGKYLTFDFHGHPDLRIHKGASVDTWPMSGIERDSVTHTQILILGGEQKSGIPDNCFFWKQLAMIS
jgi:hypothetical protein